MVFSSILFLCIFLPLVVFVYYIVPPRFRNVFLLIASLIFYAYGEPVYIVIMIFSVVVNYAAGLLLEKSRKKIILIISIIVDIGMLSFFKVVNATGIFGLVMPIGISFYTFQTLSYTIDVYRGNVKAQKNILDFGMYVCLFPQLIAGPIVRYSDVSEQIKTRKITPDKLWNGLFRFIIGLAKKVLLANQIGALWDRISANTAGLNAANAWLSALAYTFMIYFDFSGYSDMAIGLGEMFGFDFPENFKHPYEATSITDFWRKWHITLSSWFKEYLYIPLGGNRKGKGRMVINLLIVWALTGIWHGFGINFLMWGLYYFVILVAEKLFLLKHIEKWPKFFKHLYSIILIVFGWVIFACDKTKTLFTYMGSLFGANGFADKTSLYYITNYGILFIILALCSTSLLKKIKLKFPLQVVTAAILLAMSIAFLVGDSYNPFLYFRF